MISQCLSKRACSTMTQCFPSDKNALCCLLDRKRNTYPYTKIHVTLSSIPAPTIIIIAPHIDCVSSMVQWTGRQCSRWRNMNVLTSQDLGWPDLLLTTYRTSGKVIGLLHFSFSICKIRLHCFIGLFQGPNEM